MNIDLVINIVQELKNFQERDHKPNATVEDFRNFLNEKAYENETPTNLSQKYDLDVNNLENEIAKQVILLNRYSKILIKKALQGCDELVNEDFTYLFRLMDYESLTKSQLVEKNAHEKQTGIEIIKRMAKNNLIKETPDENDRRSVRISVTDEGKKVFAESMQQITLASKIMCGDFDNDEKKSFLKMLKKLNLFHHTIYTTMRNEELQVLEKMI